MKLLLPGFLGPPENLPSRLSDLCTYGKNLTLIGYSMGGRIALQFAHKYPEYVKEAIAISANPGIPEKEIPARILWENKWLKAIEEPNFLEKWYAQPLFDSLRESENYPAMLEERKKVDLKKASKLFDHYRLSKQPNLWKELPNMPVRFLFGTLDTKYLTFHNRLLAMGITSELIPDCGHAIPTEAPHIVASMR
ncbi:MAG: hypothetical protein ChlgKO_10390 [Chlamydiales bacterium]